MTSVDEIERRSVAASDAAAASNHEFAVELTETLRLAVPIALTQLGQIAMMTTDLVLIGRLGDEAVAAAAIDPLKLLGRSRSPLSWTSIFGMDPEIWMGANFLTWSRSRSMTFNVTSA